jgi:hypothetical protein
MTYITRQVKDSAAFLSVFQLSYPTTARAEIQNTEVSHFMFALRIFLNLVLTFYCTNKSMSRFHFLP